MEDEQLFYIGIKTLIQDFNGNVLLLQTNSKRKKSAQVYWDLPGGRIKQHDSIQETLLREVEEETGISKLSQISLFDVCVANPEAAPFPNSYKLFLVIYACNPIEQSHITISSEHEKYQWVPKHEIRFLLDKKYPKEIIDKIENFS